MGNIPYLDHHIFDGSFRWMIKESQKQPFIKLRISTNESDYQTFKKPCPKISPSTVQAIADTGAKSSFMGLKVFLRCGFSESDLLPVNRNIFSANNEGIIILGVVFVHLTGVNRNNSNIKATESIYVLDTINLYYLSRKAMEQLKIISPCFPQIGAATSDIKPGSFSSPFTEDCAEVNGYISTEHACNCPKRTLLLKRLGKLPFASIPGNNGKMKE